MNAKTRERLGLAGAIAAVSLVLLTAPRPPSSPDAGGAASTAAGHPLTFTGGCRPFVVVAGGVMTSFGATLRRAPSGSAKALRWLAPGRALAVDGWLRDDPLTSGEANGSVWLHAPAGSGWVAWSEVSAASTTVDIPSGPGRPVPLVESCHGALL